MIWGIVLIPISLLMAIGVRDPLFQPSHRCALPAAPRHNATPDVAGTHPAAHGGRSVAALKATPRLRDFKGAALAAPRKSRAALDPRARDHSPLPGLTFVLWSTKVLGAGSIGKSGLIRELVRW